MYSERKEKENHTTPSKQQLQFRKKETWSSTAASASSWSVLSVDSTSFRRAGYPRGTHPKGVPPDPCPSVPREGWGPVSWTPRPAWRDWWVEGAPPLCSRTYCGRLRRHRSTSWVARSMARGDPCVAVSGGSPIEDPVGREARHRSTLRRTPKDHPRRPRGPRFRSRPRTPDRAGADPGRTGTGAGQPLFHFHDVTGYGAGSYFHPPRFSRPQYVDRDRLRQRE